MKVYSMAPMAAPKIQFARWFVILSICLTQFAGIALAGGARPFKGTFHGFAQAPTPTDDLDIVEIVVPLRGNATHLGKYEMLLVHYLNTVTLEFTGYTEWTAANGDKLYTTFVGQGYPPDAQGWLAFDVTHTIEGGTGRFKNATGTFEGVDGRFNPGTLEDVGGYIGTISY